MQTILRDHLTILPYLKKAPVYIIPLAGVILILFASHLTTLLPYVLGPIMILEGILLGIPAICSKEYKVIETKATAGAVVLCIVGVLILYKHDDCLSLLGTVWGLYGLISGTHELNEAFYRMGHKQRFVLPLLEAVITLALAVLLLADPFHSFVHHVQILGIELILSVFRPSHHDATENRHSGSYSKSSTVLPLETDSVGTAPVGKEEDVGNGSSQEELSSRVQTTCAVKEVSSLTDTDTIQEPEDDSQAQTCSTSAQASEYEKDCSVPV